MTLSADSRQLTLALAAADATDLAELRELTMRLCDELQGTTAVEYATVVPQTLPPLANSKSPTQLTSDPILLTLAVTAIPSTILLIQQWLLRQQNQTLKAKIGEVELEVPRNASQAEIDRIINAVRRMAPTKRK